MKPWKIEMWRADRARRREDLVRVHRPRQWIQPVTSRVKLRQVGAWKQASNTASSGRNVLAKMTSGIAPSTLVLDTSRMNEEAMLQLGAARVVASLLRNGGRRG
jgi:hypothetical protein